MTSTTFKEIVDFIRSLYPGRDMIPLHEPVFIGNEKKYVNDCIDSTFVSSVGKYVDLFEKKIAEYTGSKYAVATVNGTSALHIALMLAGVKPGDEVITQPLTFIATANAIKYCGANPVFLDIDRETLGLSHEGLELFLKHNTIQNTRGETINKLTRNRIKACVPVHTFGHPCKIDIIKKICDRFNLTLVEDSAESIGSLYKDQHVGTFGQFGILSFNGNKIITAGGGGMILMKDIKKANLARHITTQAKVPHPWEYKHDRIGYNYRLPNINAALGLGQIEQLNQILQKKRVIASKYKSFFKDSNLKFIEEPHNSKSNYWLNSIIISDNKHRNSFLKYSNLNKILCRPAWNSLNELPMFTQNFSGPTTNIEKFGSRIINLPSGVM